MPQVLPQPEDPQVVVFSQSELEARVALYWENVLKLLDPTGVADAQADSDAMAYGHK